MAAQMPAMPDAIPGPKTCLQARQHLEPRLLKAAPAYLRQPHNLKLRPSWATDSAMHCAALTLGRQSGNYSRRWTCRLACANSSDHGDRLMCTWGVKKGELVGWGR